MLEQKGTTSQVDVLIAGAGMAGLMAACVLAEAGKSVLLVEARDRIGGRMHSLHFPDVDGPVELGAEFVHGMPQDLLSLIEEAGLHLEEVDGKNYCFDGAHFSACPQEDASSIVEAMESFCDQHPDLDMSFAEFVQERPFDDTTRDEAIRFIEGFNAADASIISIQALHVQQRAEAAIQGERAFRIREGYSALADHLFGRFVAAGGKVQLETRVERVAWSSDDVTMAGTCDGTELSLPRARHAVVALPLGVLQSNSVDFQPRPPLLDSLGGLVMGRVLRLTLIFTRRFWDTVKCPYGDVSFLFADKAVPGVFWTRSPSLQPSLTAWAGGPSAMNMDAQTFADRSLETLARVFGMSIRELEDELVSAHLHPWNNDKLTRGAYSYVRKGGLAGSHQLSMPVRNTLFFAGEHTDQTGHWGTVHGAMRSGMRVAHQILEVCKNDDAIH